MRIFFSAGEPSGDLHGANLIRALRTMEPQIECVGYGGPQMAAAGCQLHADLTQLAVMWFLRVLVNLRKFWGLLRQASRYLREHPVDAVVLIDYPGFNWWMARLAKRHGVPVFYYGVPQIWAWAGWRVRKMRRLVDHVLCMLPFEAAWYRRRGCRATYVGHPYFDQMQRQRLDAEFLARFGGDPRPLVTILPGSRSQEVTKNLRWFLKAASRIRQLAPGVRFAIASFNQHQAEIARAECSKAGLAADVFVGRTPELIHLAHCCMACSGSVSLELLYHLKPTVILYHVPPVAWLAQTLVRRVKYITLVNLLAADDIRATWPATCDPDARGAERVPFPEYLTYGDKSRRIAGHVLRWLVDPQQREKRVTQLAQLKASYCRPGASHTAARYLAQALSDRPQQPRRPRRAA